MASAETPQPSQLTQSSPFQLSTLVPKSFFSNQQPVRNKHPAGWKRNDEPSPQPLPFIVPKKQVDTNTKNVFGQPRLRASLRDLRSPRKNYKSTIEDDLKKLIIMDNLGPEQERDAGQSPQKSLQWTLSDESLCNGSRSPASPTMGAWSQGCPAMCSSAAPAPSLPAYCLPTSSTSTPSHLAAALVVPVPSLLLAMASWGRKPPSRPQSFCWLTGRTGPCGTSTRG